MEKGDEPMALIELTAYSHALEMEVDFFVILPEDAKALIGMEGKAAKRCKTLYLLHGMSDDHSIWLRRTSIDRYASEKGLAVVMPAGDLSFYTDMAYGEKYWEFVARELPAICRSFFPMMSDRREDTFVAGLSMGGYGALKCGLRGYDTFSCAAGLSAAVDVVGAHKNGGRHAGLWHDILGDDPNELVFNDLFTAAEDYAKGSNLPPLRLYAWCGREDFLYESNLRFKAHLEKLGLDFTYEEGPGNHSWQYWDDKIQRVLEWLPLGKEEQ